jgi:hypothetical protein
MNCLQAVRTNYSGVRALRYKFIDGLDAHESRDCFLTAKSPNCLIDNLKFPAIVALLGATDKTFQ